MKSIALYLLLISLSWGLVSCQKSDIVNINRSDRLNDSTVTSIKPIAFSSTTSKLSETAPPSVIEELGKSFEQSAPEVSILSPQSDRVFADTSVNVKLQIKNLAIFKDDKLGMGPHLHLILDNEPYRAVYSVDEPIILENLTPGTHTIRVFASRPWHESFKNEGAYAQTTFHVLTKTNSNNPDSNLPLITYSRPKGSYSAEPIMLDFYLTNAPLHLVAQENPNDDIKDWHIRVTVDGERFILDDWQPVYLQGFNKGNNWIQLELLDEDGNNIENAFNNTVRLVNFDPRAKDTTLDRLVTGKMAASEALSIVKQNYDIQPVETPEAIEPTVAESEPVVTDEKIEVIESEPVVEEESEVVESESEPEITEETTTLDRSLSTEESQKIIEEQFEAIDSKTAEASVTDSLSTSEVTANEETTETETVEIIAVEPDSETTEPEVILEIPDVEAITITEDKIAIETSTNEPEVASQPETKFNLLDWVKNIWSNVQRKAQNVVKALRE